MEVREFPAEKWREVVNGFADSSLMQSWEFAQARAASGPWQVERSLFIDDGQPVGAVQVSVRRIFGIGRGLAWVNSGPLWRRNGAEPLTRLLHMLSELRRYWVVERRMYLRVAVPLPAGELSSAEIASAGFAVTDFPGRASARIDLTQTPEILRKQLKQKWRNCLNKAELQGMTLDVGTGQLQFDAFLHLYRDMFLNKAFATSATPELLARLNERLPAEQKFPVLLAYKAGEPVAGVLIATYGRVAEYLAGTVNDVGRPLNAGHFLLWQAVCYMKALGYSQFDVGGMHPERTPRGIYHFKAGLGGTPFQWMHELEAYDGSLLTRLVRMQVQRARREASEVS